MPSQWLLLRRSLGAAQPSCCSCPPRWLHQPSLGRAHREGALGISRNLLPDADRLACPVFSRQFQAGLGLMSKLHGDLLALTFNGKRAYRSFLYPMRNAGRKGQIWRGCGPRERTLRAKLCFGWNNSFFFFLFWPCCMACSILAPQPWIEPTFSAREIWSPNHWTIREFPRMD